MNSFITESTHTPFTLKSSQNTMKSKILLILIMAVLPMMSTKLSAQAEDQDKTPDKLVVVWTSGDPEVAESVALMYTHAAKANNWFKEVTLIVWGPSAKLLAENEKLQEKVKKMQKDGVVLEACIACANLFGVADNLKKLGIDVKGMGVPLTGYLKSGAKVITF